MPKTGLLISVATIVIIVLILFFRVGASGTGSGTDSLIPVGFFGPFKRKKATAPAAKPR